MTLAAVRFSLARVELTLAAARLEMELAAVRFSLARVELTLAAARFLSTHTVELIEMFSKAGLLV